ncbi:MAG: hypothetical protein CM1200mP29_13480 [Verrucomicrobiota bacterium]|nr:MAG: hypothetical protein CM1200mP29_13480 [Verrucomicrobiota bacterium]
MNASKPLSQTLSAWLTSPACSGGSPSGKNRLVLVRLAGSPDPVRLVRGDGGGDCEKSPAATALSGLLPEMLVGMTSPGTVGVLREWLGKSGFIESPGGRRGMLGPVRVSIVIPAFNEANYLPGTLRAAPEARAAFGQAGWGRRWSCATTTQPMRPLKSPRPTGRGSSSSHSTRSPPRATPPAARPRGSGWGSSMPTRGCRRCSSVK